MSKVAKLKRQTLCDWSKSDIEKKMALLAQITDHPRFACRKCARVANSTKQLCKPAPLPAAKPTSLVG